MLKNAFFLFHQGSGDFSGSYSEIYSHMQDYETQVKGLSQIIREHTDFSEEYITDNIVNEWYIRADDALKYKVVDGVVDDISLIYNKYKE